MDLEEVGRMIRALLDYMGEHVSGDGAWWILGLNAILLIPVMFCRVLLSEGGADSALGPCCCY